MTFSNKGVLRGLSLIAVTFVLIRGHFLNLEATAAQENNAYYLSIFGST